MLNARLLLCTVVVAMPLTMAGCGKEEAPAPTPSAGGSAAGAGASDAKKDAEAAKTAGSDSMKGPAPTPAPGDAAKPAGPDVKAAADDASKQAQSLYEQAMTAIKDKKWDDAQKLVDQLDGMKDSLPKEWAQKITDLKSALTVSKAHEGAAGMGIPGMPSK